MKKHLCLVIALIAVLLMVMGCSGKPGASFENLSQETVTFSIGVTGEDIAQDAQGIAPGESALLPIPANKEITVSAMLSSGFKVNSLYTPDELAEGCKGSVGKLSCRFHYTGKEINLIKANAAEDFASVFSIGLMVFSALLLGVTVWLFVKFKGRRPVDEES